MESPAFCGDARGRAAGANIHAGIPERQGIAQSIGEAKGGAEVRPTGLIEAAPEVLLPSRKNPTVETYLRGLAAACCEAASNPRTRGLLFALLLRAPSTLAQLGRERRRIAA